jgi:hypothetical protein
VTAIAKNRTMSACRVTVDEVRLMGILLAEDDEYAYIMTTHKENVNGNNVVLYRYRLLHGL